MRELYKKCRWVNRETVFQIVSDRQKKPAHLRRLVKQSDKNFLMFTHQYLWDLNCSNPPTSAATAQSQQLPAKCNQLCDM